MKKLTVILILFLFAGTLTAAGSNTNKVRVKTIPTYGMHCTGCEETIETEIKKLDGIKSVKADHVKKTVTVKYDDRKVTLEQVKQTIQTAGYKLTE